MTKCAYHNCENTHRDISMFRFPVHDKDRLLLWIIHSGKILSCIIFSPPASNATMHWLTILRQWSEQRRVNYELSTIFSLKKRTIDITFCVNKRDANTNSSSHVAHSLIAVIARRQNYRNYTRLQLIVYSLKHTRFSLIAAGRTTALGSWFKIVQNQPKE